MGNIAKQLTLSGKIDSQNYAVLRFQTSGMFSWLGVKEGDRVKKWQAVASLDKKDLQKRLQKELNNYLTDRWNFEDTQDKYKTTKENYLVTPEIQRILDRQQFSLNNAVLEVELSDIALKYATLVSPINGIVAKVDYPTPGINVNPANFSVTVIDLDGIYFRSEVDEEDVTKIASGQKAKIVIDSYPDEVLESKILDIAFAPIEGQTSTTYRVKFSLLSENQLLKYRLGMNGEAKIVLEEKNDVLLIPVEAYFEENGKQFVYVKDGKTKKIARQEIVLGLESDEDIEIISGLSEKQTIVY